MSEHKVDCTGKKVFDTFKRAERRAHRMNQSHEDAHLEAYHCRHCNAFHVGEARHSGRPGRHKGSPP